MAPRSSRVVVSSGRALHVVEDGDLQGRPVLVHHGTPMSAAIYPPHVETARRRGARLIAYDRPGYGGSDPDPGRNVAQAASDVRAIADALGLGRFGVWGHSGGGSHALACGALLPDRVSAVVASATVAPYEAAGLRWTDGMGQGNLEEFAAAAAGREPLTRFIAREREQMLDVRQTELSPTLASLLSPSDLDLLNGELGAYLTRATREGVRPGPEGWVDDDLETLRPWGFDLRTFRVPVSIWHGGQDRFVPPAHGRWLAQHIPGAELRFLDEETHLTLVHRRFDEILGWLLERA